MPALATILLEPFGFEVDEAEGDPEPPAEVPVLPPDADEGAAVATPLTPPVTGPVSFCVGSELRRLLAVVRKASKVFPVSGALMDPTIP